MPKWKRGFGKVSKWTVLKFTGLALTVAFAININNTTNQIAKEVVQGEVIEAQIDSTDLHVLHAVLDELSEPDTTVVLRDSVVVRYRDSLVVTLRDSVLLVPVFETVIRDSLVRRTVWDTLETKPKKPTAWELYHGGPRIGL